MSRLTYVLGNARTGIIVIPRGNWGWFAVMKRADGWVWYSMGSPYGTKRYPTALRAAHAAKTLLWGKTP